MKKFLRHTLMFLLPAIVFGIVIGFLRYQNLLKLVNQGIKKYQTKSIFFVGDSRIGTIDIYSFDSTFVNIGQGGEHIDVSIAKIKALISENSPNAKTFYLGFSAGHIVNNPNIAEEGKRRLFKLDLYLAKERMTFTLANPKGFSQYVVFDDNNSTGFGDGRGTSTHQVFNPHKVVDPQFSVMQFHYKDTNVNEGAVIHKIVELYDYVQSNKSKLILINMPTNAMYKKYVPKTILASYKNIMSTFNKKGIQMLDYGNLYLNDSLFSDMNHLNSNGSRTFLPLVFSHNKTAD